MLSVSLFADYLHYRAVRAHHFDLLEMRVERFCIDHKALAVTCTILDMVTRALVWLAVFGVLVAIAGAMVYKTFIADLLHVAE
ncbi:hypothetical protein P9209_03380 [Prescottella defluvii]|nr:hypothetical protein P9209_03380 [Prescottella defluvii]